MPRKPKSATPLTLSEFDKLADGLTELFSRLRFTLSSNSEAQAVVDRLTRAGFLPPQRGGGRPAAKAAPAPSAETGKRRKRGRRRSKIDGDKILAAVKKGGAAGQTSGQIANTLGIPVERLRFQLYTMRDSGALKMIGDKSTAKYVVASGGGAKPAAAKPAAAAAPKKTRKKRKMRKGANGVSKKKAKAAAKPAAAASPAPAAT
jgi:hypothetical protein